MAIDLGTDFTKVAVVRPRMPMEIVLDSSSKRTIPTLVLLKEGNRLFGNGAVASITKDPKIVFAELPSIIGKTIDNPAVTAYKNRYPYHNLVFSEEHGQLAFILDGKEFPVETLMAMFLKYVRETAEAFAESEMKTAVITVPSYFTQTERRALLRAANLANIEVLQLINDNIAVALDFIRPRSKIIDEKPVYAFFDVGATGTTATLVSYQLAKVKGEVNSEHPHVFILGSASDTSLGVNVFIDRLQEHLINAFKKMHKVSTDISKNPRAVAKFRREACRVFKILSANKEIQSTIEEAYDGKDLRVKVSRSEVEEICKDLIDRVPKVLQAALKNAAATSPNVVSELREIIIFGGGTRIPAVQSALLSATTKETLGKSINSDEAAVMGAVYQAASNTPGFLVKRFVLRDLNRYPLAVTFPRINGTDNSAESELVTKVLFPANNPFPQKRTIKFPHLRKDIIFQVHYGEMPLDLSKYLHNSNAIMKVNVSSVAESVNNFEKSGHQMQAVKAHLELDASGILQLTEVNLIMVYENKTEEAKSTIEKLADGITSLFGSGDNKEKGSETISTEAPTTSDLPKADNETQFPSQNATSNNVTSGSSQKKTMIHPLPFHVQILDPIIPPDESIGVSLTILREFDAADKERNLLHAARNELERTIFITKNDIERSFDNHATKEELTALSATTNEIHEWYDEEGHSSPRSAVEEQLSKLREAVDPIKRRIKAFVELPGAFAVLENLLANQTTSIALVMSANSAEKTMTAPEFMDSLNDSMTKDDEQKKVGLPIYSLDEVEALKKLISETRTWLEETKAAFAKCDKRADPPVRLVAVTERTAALTAKLEYFSHKGEMWLITYKRLFDIKKALLLEAHRKAEASKNKSSTIVPESTPEDVQMPSEESSDEGKSEKPTTTETPESEATPRSEL